MKAEKQAWIDKQVCLITDSIEKVGPFSMTDEQWEQVVKRVDKVTKLAKGDNEVRKALFDAIEPYDKLVNDKHGSVLSQICTSLN